MHDTSFDDTLLVRRLPPLDPPRVLPATFAPAHVRTWPWIALLLATLALAAARPVNLHASQQAIERERQAEQILPTLGR